MKGLLITFEGIDGSGKTTQARLLYERLVSLGRTAHLLREPGGTAIGEKIRAILLDATLNDMTPHTELFLYLAARSQITSSVISPALQRGEDVIMDRFVDSTVAYQGCARGLGMDDTIRLNLLATGGLMPDMTFVIDCDPHTAFSRITDSFDRLESEGISFMQKVRDGFIALHDRFPERVKVCEGDRSIEVISREVTQSVKVLIPDL